MLVQLILSIDYSIGEKILAAVSCTPKFNYSKSPTKITMGVSYCWA